MKETQRDKLLKRLKIKADSGGRAAAINYMCATCIYDSEAIGAGTWLNQVKECTSNSCPLYKYRPLPINYIDDEL